MKISSSKLLFVIFISIFISPSAFADYLQAYCPAVLTGGMMFSPGKLTPEEYRQLLLRGFRALAEDGNTIDLKLFRVSRKSNPAKYDHLNKVLVQALKIPLTLNDFYNLLPLSSMTIPNIYRSLELGEPIPTPRFIARDARQVEKQQKTAERQRRHLAKLDSRLKKAEMRLKKIADRGLKYRTDGLSRSEKFSPLPEAKSIRMQNKTPVDQPPSKVITVQRPIAVPIKQIAIRIADKKSAKSETNEIAKVKEETQKEAQVITLLRALNKQGIKPNIINLAALPSGNKILDAVQLEFHSSLYDAVVAAGLDPSEVFEREANTQVLTVRTLLLRIQAINQSDRTPENAKQLGELISMEFPHNLMAWASWTVNHILLEPNLTPNELYGLYLKSMNGATPRGDKMQMMSQEVFDLILRSLSRNQSLYSYIRTAKKQ